MNEHEPSTLYVAGTWLTDGERERIEVFDSTDGTVMGSVSAATTEDVSAAVEAARDAFGAWASEPVAHRAATCEAIGEALRARADELAEVITRETGMPRRISLPVQVSVAADSFTRAAAHARTFTYEREIENSLVLYEPIGVVAAITPWNYPLLQIAAKVAPALAAGCTVVLKPSEIAPLDAVILTDVIDRLDVPAGVFNLLTGTGSEAGQALVEHPGVDMVSFTGSTVAGKHIAASAAGSIKRVALELGGKSPNVLLDDLDDATFDHAVRTGLASCFLNSGQTCSALTRMLVPRTRLADAEAIVIDEVDRRYQAGDPFTKGVRLGPLASRAQLDRVRQYVHQGQAENARMIVGGADTPLGLEDGYYAAATVFSDVDSDMVIAQEEIFGPVLSLMPYDSESEAIAIANDSPYGLAGGVWSADPQRAEAVARQLRTGRVDINGGAYNSEAPFGGYKQSGYGRENGVFGFEEYLEVKALQR